MINDTRDSTLYMAQNLHKCSIKQLLYLQIKFNYYSGFREVCFEHEFVGNFFRLIY